MTHASRYEEIEFLLDIRFPLFVKRIRPKLRDAIKATKKADISDEVVDLVRAGLRYPASSMWSDPGDRLSAKTFVKAKFGSLDEVVRLRESWRRFIDDACGYEAELNELTDHQVLELANRKRSEIDAVRRAKIDAREQSTDRWAIFSRPTANADFAHWLSIPSWSFEEAIALSFGKDPRAVSSATIASPRPSAFRRIYQIRMEQMRRATILGDLTEPVRPTNFVAWAKDQKIELPAELHASHFSESDRLRNEVLRLEKRVGELEKEYKALLIIDAFEMLDRMSKESLFKIILGIAINKFDYLKNKRPGTAGKISNLINRGPAHFDLGDDAINKWLKEAVKYLEFDAAAAGLTPLELPESG
ncbi:hypothetical protein NKH92_04015 [Mesorhizobium sp. M0871]|uniref:hypothetical protein n=1 Tax=Mesorhizobium sp. M0871 TaxID=2957017 RepID=UPI003335F14A